MAPISGSVLEHYFDTLCFNRPFFLSFTPRCMLSLNLILFTLRPFDAFFLKKKLQHLLPMQQKIIRHLRYVTLQLILRYVYMFVAAIYSPKSVSFRYTTNCAFADREHTGNLLHREVLF